MMGSTMSVQPGVQAEQVDFGMLLLPARYCSLTVDAVPEPVVLHKALPQH